MDISRFWNSNFDGGRSLACGNNFTLPPWKWPKSDHRVLTPATSFESWDYWRRTGEKFSNHTCPFLAIDDTAKGGLTTFWELFTVIPCVPKDIKRQQHHYLKNFVSQIIVCSQTSCAVLSHCFTDCTCARESVFFVSKLVARATNYITIVLITNSIKICIICHLCEPRFHVDYWGGN